LRASPRLSDTALTALDEAKEVYVSPVGFFEIAQRVRDGTWPEMSGIVRELPSLLAATALATCLPLLSANTVSISWRIDRGGHRAAGDPNGAPALGCSTPCRRTPR